MEKRMKNKTNKQQQQNTVQLTRLKFGTEVEHTRKNISDND